jgi:hypothetical protein
MTLTSKDIFTPQGLLAEVEKNPNLDFLMNVFNIPRVFGVSGFGGNWNVGKHSFAAALIALFWAKFNSFSEERRDRLVVMALTHDLHESVTGDILPMFKSAEVKKDLDLIQDNILKALQATYDDSLKIDLKIVDYIAFIYEITQVSPSILNPKKLALAHKILDRQMETLFVYCQEKQIEKDRVQKFMKEMEI